MGNKGLNFAIEAYQDRDEEEKAAFFKKSRFFCKISVEKTLQLLKKVL